MLAGYLCKQILKKYKSCTRCEEGVRFKSDCVSSVSQLVQMKSHGGLIHANHHFFNLIRHIEASFAKYSSCVDVFDFTLDDVLEKLIRLHFLANNTPLTSCPMPSFISVYE